MGTSCLLLCRKELPRVTGSFGLWQWLGAGKTGRHLHADAGKENGRLTKMTEEKKILYRRLIKITSPIAFQSLMLAAVAAGDAFMLGQVGQDEMAAVSLATQVQFIQNMLMSGATAAGAILVKRF